jgi:GNAT superfamily N-acetyltransferase
VRPDVDERRGAASTVVVAPLARLAGDDGRRLADLVARCSPDTLAARFHTAAAPAADRAVASLARHLGSQFGVLVGGVLVGCGGLVAAGPGRVEAAVLVADPWQGRGLGRRLLRHALADPGRPGREVVAHVRLDNERALRAARAVLGEVAESVAGHRQGGSVEFRAAVPARSPLLHPTEIEEPA